MFDEAPLCALRVPEGWCIAYNDLREYPADHPDAWTLVWKSDLLMARHDRRNRLLDLGWYPDGEADGCYLIEVFEGDCAGRVLHVFETMDRAEAIAEIERLFASISGQAASP